MDVLNNKNKLNYVSNITKALYNAIFLRLQIVYLRFLARHVTIKSI